MSSFSLRPTAALLSPYVTGLHFIENDDAPPPELERILPAGRVHFMVNLHEDEFRLYNGANFSTIGRTRGAVLEGATSSARVIDTGLQRCLVSVDFTLGGAAAFFDMPISEANDALVELEILWGAGGASLRSRLLEAPTPMAKLRVLESVLLQHVVGEGVDVAIPCAASLLERGVPVKEVASRVGLLPKTLLRRFTACVGLTPKRYARVRRLQRVLGAVCDTGDIDWCDVAATHGYVDQAHLVHEFRELTGITPTAYRARSSEGRNHVPVIDP